MKNVFKSITTLFFSALILAALMPTAHAEDCLNDPFYDRNWNAEVTTGARLRDIPCMTTSIVITALPVGEVVKVIQETDGYYKIQRKDGTQGWVGQWLITATAKPFGGSATAVTAAPAQTAAPTKIEPLYDIVGNKNEPDIRALFNLKIVSGNPDGSFKPDSPLNRAELVKLLVGASVQNFESIKDKYNISCFPDVMANQWYTPYVCYSKEKNIVKGYDDNTFKPARNISKAEAVKVVIGSFGLSSANEATKTYFNDVGLNAWYAPHLQAAYEQSLLEEKENEAFKPDTNILRGAVSHIIYQAYLLTNNTPTI